MTAIMSHDRYFRDDDYADVEDNCETTFDQQQQSQSQSQSQQQQQPPYEIIDGDEMGVREFIIPTASDDDSRCSSPTSWSVYSYESSVDHQRMLREIHGRVFNNTSELYMLPADATEHSRLDLQHEMLKKKMNGLFVRPELVARALAPKQVDDPAVLDVGSGSGCWVLDVGKQFPHVQVLGIDLAPPNLSSSPLHNCHFECDDVNLGLEGYYNQYDVVNARCVSSGIQDYRAFLDDVAQVLRPGGVFQSVECDMQLYDENRRAITAEGETEPGFSWTQKLSVMVQSAMEARGPGIRAIPHISRYVEEMDGVWEVTGTKEMWIPVGPWESSLTERGSYIAELMRQDVYKFTESVRPLLLHWGIFEENIDMWTENLHDELKSLRRRMYLRWVCSWAVKKQAKTSSNSYYF